MIHVQWIDIKTPHADIRQREARVDWKDLAPIKLRTLRRHMEAHKEEFVDWHKWNLLANLKNVEIQFVVYQNSWYAI